MTEYAYRVMEQIMQMKTCVIVTLIATGLIIVTLLLLTHKFGWNEKNLKVMGFVYEIGRLDTLLLAVCMVRMCLVISFFIDGAVIYPIHLASYIFLSFFYIIHWHRFKQTLLSTINTAVVAAVLYVSNFLATYIREVAYDKYLMIILFMLMIFLLLYAIYDLAFAVYSMVTDERRWSEKA